MKFLSPQALWRTIFTKWPQGMWGGSYSKHCLLGSLIGPTFSSIFFSKETPSPFVPGRWNPSIVFLKMIFYYFHPCNSWVSQSFSPIFFITAWLLVKRIFSHDLYSSSIEDAIIFLISPLKISLSSKKMCNFFMPIIDCTLSPMKFQNLTNERLICLENMSSMHRFAFLGDFHCEEGLLIPFLFEKISKKSDPCPPVDYLI